MLKGLATPYGLLHLAVLSVAVMHIFIARCDGQETLTDSFQGYSRISPQSFDVPISDLDDGDRYIVDANKIDIKKADEIRIRKWRLSSPENYVTGRDSFCASDIAILYFEENKCKSSFCTLVIKCDNIRRNDSDVRLMLKATQDIYITAWEHRTNSNYYCVKQAIRLVTPEGPLTVLIGKYGFQIVPQNTPPPPCGGGHTF